MKGTILDYSMQENKGAITTESGERYYFSGVDWKSDTPPQKGMAVDFEEGADKAASMIYIDIKQPKQSKTNAFIKSNVENTKIDYDAESHYTIADWAKKAIENSFNFNGRSRRKEYWSFALVFFIFYVIAVLIDYVLKTEAFKLIAFLIGFMPNVAVTTRRLHDINMSGWFALLLIIPLVGMVFSIIVACLDTNKEENEWGMPAKIV